MAHFSSSSSSEDEDASTIHNKATLSSISTHGTGSQPRTTTTTTVAASASAAASLAARRKAQELQRRARRESRFSSSSSELPELYECAAAALKDPEEVLPRLVEQIQTAHTLQLRPPAIDQQAGRSAADIEALAVQVLSQLDTDQPLPHAGSTSANLVSMGASTLSPRMEAAAEEAVDTENQLQRSTAIVAMLRSARSNTTAVPTGSPTKQDSPRSRQLRAPAFICSDTTTAKGSTAVAARSRIFGELTSKSRSSDYSDAGFSDEESASSDENMSYNQKPTHVSSVRKEVKQPHNSYNSKEDDEDSDTIGFEQSNTTTTTLPTQQQPNMSVRTEKRSKFLKKFHKAECLQSKSGNKARLQARIEAVVQESRKLVQEAVLEETLQLVDPQHGLYISSTTTPTSGSGSGNTAGTTDSSAIDKSSYFLMEEILQIKPQHRSKVSRDAVVRFLQSGCALSAYLSQASYADLLALSDLAELRELAPIDATRTINTSTANTTSSLNPGHKEKITQETTAGTQHNSRGTSSGSSGEALHIRGEPILAVYVILRGSLQVTEYSVPSTDKTSIIANNTTNNTINNNSNNNSNNIYTATTTTTTTTTTATTTSTATTTRTLQPGECLGESILHSQHSWAVDVHSLPSEKAILCCLPIDAVLRYIGRRGSDVENAMILFYKYHSLWGEIKQHNINLLKHSKYQLFNKKKKKERENINFSFQPMNIITSARLKIYQAGMEIFQQDQNRQYFYLIIRGCCEYKRKFNGNFVEGGLLPSEIDVGLSVMCGDFSFMDGEDHLYTEQMQEGDDQMRALLSHEHANSAINKYRLEKYNRFEKHKNALVAISRVEVILIPIKEIAHCMKLFIRLLKLSTELYPKLFVSNSALVRQHYEGVRWAQQRGRVLQEVAKDRESNTLREAWAQEGDRTGRAATNTTARENAPTTGRSSTTTRATSKVSTQDIALALADPSTRWAAEELHTPRRYLLDQYFQSFEGQSPAAATAGTSSVKSVRSWEEASSSKSYRTASQKLTATPPGKFEEETAGVGASPRPPPLWRPGSVKYSAEEMAKYMSFASSTDTATTTVVRSEAVPVPTPPARSTRPSSTRPNSAAEIHSNGRRPQSAAEIHSSGRRPQSAAEIYSSGRRPQSAAEIHSNGRRPQSAANIHSSGRRPQSAAEIHTSGRRPQIATAHSRPATAAAAIEREAHHSALSHAPSRPSSAGPIASYRTKHARPASAGAISNHVQVSAVGKRSSQEVRDNGLHFIVDESFLADWEGQQQGEIEDGPSPAAPGGSRSATAGHTGKGSACTRPTAYVPQLDLTSRSAAVPASSVSHSHRRQQQPQLVVRFQPKTSIDPEHFVQVIVAITIICIIYRRQSYFYHFNL